MSIRFPRTITLILLTLAMSTTTWGQSTLIEKSLDRIKTAPATDSFDFIVYGDSNSLEPLVQTDLIRQFVREFNILKPDLVVQVGDTILGGAAEGVPAQWDVFDRMNGELTVPFFPLPGNHDITDEATQQIWLERLGPTHYSFEYGNSCFILLDSEEMGDEERISDQQVSWLKEQLEATKATNIFVFLHRPYFEHLGDPDGAAESWRKRWSNVAEAFKGHPVRAVFAGHEHTYRDCGVRDGVRYVICGGAAAYGLSDGEAEGDFNHYLQVRVRGDKFSWAVTKPNAILPEDVVTSDRINELYNVRHTWIAAEEVFVPIGEPVKQAHRIKVSNPHGKAISSTLTWEVEPGWTVTPQSSSYDVPAGGSTELTFQIEARSGAEARYPVPVFKTRYEGTQFGPPVDVEQNLPLVPVVAASRAKTPVALDAKLNDWKDVQFAPFTYPVGFKGTDPSDLSARIGFQWDSEYLYMAVETQDNEHNQPYAGDIVWSADNVEMFLGEWSYGLTLTNNGPEVFMYWGLDVAGQTLAPEVKLAVVREGTTTTYEAAFPRKNVAPLALEAGSSFRFNALMNDLDPGGPEPKRHWLELVPEKGVGGSTPPRVKVELRD